MKKGEAMMDDQQRRMRVEFDAEVWVTLPGQAPIYSISHNISLNGIYLELADLSFYVENKECEVGLKLPASSPPIVLKMKGKMIRCDSEGIGIQFTEMDDNSFLHLKQLVLFNAPDYNAAIDQIKNRPGFK